MIFLRSLLFNIFFYGFNALACLVLMPLAFCPRPLLYKTVLFYVNGCHWIEKNILGLDYEVRGLENLPKESCFICASKHQSAFETTKLHRIFHDPTIILKQELLRIPIFGIFLQKVDVIPVNRKSRDKSIKALIDGTQRMIAQGRPIIIFPQGTRTEPQATPKDKPYKGGVLKVYRNSDIPIVPMALNSGLFWGRNKFIKKPGKVIFEFLPPIPQGKEDAEVMHLLEKSVEHKSIELMIEAAQTYPYINYTPPENYNKAGIEHAPAVEMDKDAYKENEHSHA